MENKTAAQQLIEQFKDWLNHELGHDFTSMMLLEKIENGALDKYVEMEKQQHGGTWNEAVEAMHLRGGNTSRAICDFDEYYSETFKKPTE